MQWYGDVGTGFVGSSGDFIKVVAIGYSVHVEILSIRVTGGGIGCGSCVCCWWLRGCGWAV